MSARDLMNGLPTWAKVISVIGIPGAIAFWLLWLVTGAFMDWNERLGTHVGRDEAHTQLLQAICVNTAPSEDRREACFYWRGRRFE